MLLAHSIILSYLASLNPWSDLMVNTCARADNLLWFMQPSHNGSSESFNKSKNLAASALGSFSTIYNWTLTDITLIHSHCIHNHIPVRISVVICCFMHVVSTKSWPNHHFFHSPLINKYFSVCIPTLAILYKPFCVEDASLQHLDANTFYFDTSCMDT